MLTYDTSNLQKLFEQLDPKNRKKAIKGGVSRAGTQVRKAAIRNLRSRMKGSGKELEKGIRKVNYRKQLGFRVTIGSKKSGKSRGDTLSQHTNRGGKTKPVLIWAEGGTDERFTKTATRIFRRRKRGHSTGRMPRYGFMERTRQEMKGKVDEMLKDEIVKNIQRIARKHGCRVT